MGKKSFSTRDIVYIGMFIAIMTVCAWIIIPMTVPFTLQIFAVFAAAAMLGFKRGSLAIGLYIVIGAIGVPVFSGFSGGIGAIMGPTGGYIIGFLVAAMVAGGLMDLFGKSLPVMIISMLLGLAACYLFGTIWFMIVYARTNSAVGILTTLGWCVFPYIIPDCIKIALAIVVDKRLGRYVK